MFNVQNVNIANIVTVIIQHSIVANVVQMNLKKDLLPVRTGESTACGMMQAKGQTKGRCSLWRILTVLMIWSI